MCPFVRFLSIQFCPNFTKIAAGGLACFTKDFKWVSFISLSDEDDYGFMNTMTCIRSVCLVLLIRTSILMRISTFQKHKSQLFHRTVPLMMYLQRRWHYGGRLEDIPEEEAEDIGIFSHIKYLLMDSRWKKRYCCRWWPLSTSFLDRICHNDLGIRFSHDQPQHLQ